MRKRLKRLKDKYYDIPLVRSIPAPYDKVFMPNQLVTGICLDCEESRYITRVGTCSVCGSFSILKKGAVKALRDELKLRGKVKV